MPPRSRPSNEQRYAAVQAQIIAQTHVVALMLANLPAAWALLDVANPATLAPFIRAVAALVDRYGKVSASIAADFYEQARRDAGVLTPYTIRPVDPAPIEQVDASVRWATKDLWTVTAKITPAEKSGEKPADIPVAEKTPEEKLDAAKAKVDGVAHKLVVDTGRREIAENLDHDDKAHGWARVTRPGCCAFCAMLAQRGAVYKSESSAIFTLADERYHNNCVCYPDPFWGPAYVMPAKVREWRALWKTSTAGYSGDDALNAFRRAFERPARSGTT